MPVARRRREDKFVDIFLSAYDGGSWKDAHVGRPERTQDNAVEAIARRKSDNKRLAIEHTIVEPFVGDKADVAQFWPAFEKLQEDPSFAVANRITRVFVPVGVLDGHKAGARQAIVNGIADWLKDNIAKLPENWSKRVCKIDLPEKSPLDVVLNIEVLPTPNYSSFRVWRQQVSIDLDKVVEKALRNKLPKLVKTTADQRILMLERQHMNLLPKQITTEIEKLRPSFPDLKKVDEIWIAETIFYETDNNVFFFRYDSEGGTQAEIGFWDGQVRIS